MVVVDNPDAAERWSRRIRRAGLSLGLVPTMGALHDGHYALIERARRECDRAAVTIFVNPTQFCPGEDFHSYPRTLETDIEGCRTRGVDLVLSPAEDTNPGIYPPGFQTWVEVVDLSGPLCGEHRPGHFRGVATVVAILLGIFRPHRVYFGQKDFQQTRLIERMVTDLRLGAEVIMVPTVREPDGLALSSRNRYLSREERARASAIPEALRRVEKAWRSGEMSGPELKMLATERLGRESGLRIEYVEILDARSLKPLPGDRVDHTPEGAVLAVAVILGSARLIDNIFLRREVAGSRVPEFPTDSKGN